MHGGEAIRVELIDKSTGNIVASGLESRVKLDVVVLAGDFNHEDDDDEWTREDFENHVVKGRLGKRPLLAGELKVSLKGGVGSLGDVTFTDNSSWIPCKKFRLGFRVQSGFCEGISIREAKTNAFTVKEHRGQGRVPRCFILSFIHIRAIFMCTAHKSTFLFVLYRVRKAPPTFMG